MNQSDLSDPLALITNLPWPVRQALHIKLRNRCQKDRLVQWFSRQTNTQDLRLCHQALLRYQTGEAYRQWLEQDTQSAIITALLHDTRKPRSGNRLALSLMLEQFQTTTAVSKATGSGQ